MTGRDILLAIAGSLRGLLRVTLDDVFILPERVKARAFARSHILVDAVPLVDRGLRLAQQLAASSGRV